MTNENIRNQKPGSERVVKTVASWPGVTIDDGWVGSQSFQLSGTEIGHVHPKLVDIDYPKPLRDQLIADGQTAEHHTVPMHPTGTTFRVDLADDIDHAIWLFRLTYLVHVAVLRQRGEAESMLIDLDLDELNKLEPTDAIRDAFEAAVERGQKSAATDPGSVLCNNRWRTLFY